MHYYLTFLISQSILLPLIAGLVRLRRLDASYWPFFILVAIGALTEVISFISIRLWHTNLVVANTYCLIEWTFIAWQFHVWGFLETRKNIFYTLLGLVAAAWVVENLVFGNITSVVPYFRFLYFFLIVLMSINTINFMITHENRNLLRTPRFLICIGFIIYFIYMIVDFWAIEISKLGQPSIMETLAVWGFRVNVLTNLIYAIAFLVIPRPQKFTLE